MQAARGDEPQYVFLICSERSGSNLMSAIMNSHPQVGSTPPYHFCRDVGLAWHAVAEAGVQSAAGQAMRKLVAERVTQFRSADDAATLDAWIAANPAASFGALTRRLFIETSGLQGKPLVFVKENNIHKMMFFLLQHFPQAKFVFQVRDPRDYFLSGANLREGRFGNKFGSSFHAMEVWREDQLGGLAALAHLGRDRVFLQRYEDLVSDPRTVLTALCRFLGLEFSEKMLEFNETEYATDLAKPGARENLSKPLMSDNFGKYRKELSPEQIRMVEIHLGDLMERFGYARDFPDTKQAPSHEVLFAQFIEPFERMVNSETKPFYGDGQLSPVITRHAEPLATSYARG